jgi:glycosyltransferase involved in cell wall biosynthesis
MIPPLADVILFSTADWNSKYWTNKQHIASQLADRGHRVLYVETVGLRRPSLNKSDAARIVSRFRNGLSATASLRQNVWRLSPLTVPFFHSSLLVTRLNSQHLKTRIARWMTANHVVAPIVWTYHPYVRGIADFVNASNLIYHCADNLGAIPGVDVRSFEAAERKLLACANVVFTTSRVLQGRCSAIVGERAHYFGNVADVAHFGNARRVGQLPPELERIPRPRLGYLGALSDFKLDFDLLGSIADHRPDWQLVLIGDEREGQADARLARLATRENVHMLGWRPYAQLPDYMAGIDVGLLPQLVNDYTQSMFPMKFFEYIAAGVPVVSTPLDAIKEFGSLYRLGADAASFIGAIEANLVSPPDPLPLDHPVLLKNCWATRLDNMLEVVGCARRHGKP